jgi:hypothetical protein
MLQVVKGLPPNIDQIRATLPGADLRTALFCYGNVVYSVQGGKLSAPLRAHEAVHSVRQGSDPAGWWRKYLADPEFRLAEEVPAHQAEYTEFCKNEMRDKARFSFLVNCAQRLSGPLYGSLITFTEARRMILGKVGKPQA